MVIFSNSFFCFILILGHHKCRENWPEHSEKYERTFNLFLDVILLVLPLLMLGATYSLITKTLWQDMQTETFGSCKGSSRISSTKICSSEYLMYQIVAIESINVNIARSKEQ